MEEDKDKDKLSCTPDASCGCTKGHSRETHTSGFGELPLAVLAMSSHLKFLLEDVTKGWWMVGGGW